MFGAKRLEQESVLYNFREKFHQQKRMENRSYPLLQARYNVMRMYEQGAYQSKEVEEVDDWDEAVNWHIQQQKEKEQQEIAVHQEIEREINAERDRYFQDLWDQKCRWEYQEQKNTQRQIVEFLARNNISEQELMQMRHTQMNN